jgi:hypothetical protein
VSTAHARKKRERLGREGRKNIQEMFQKKGSKCFGVLHSPKV